MAKKIKQMVVRPPSYPVHIVPMDATGEVNVPVLMLPFVPPLGYVLVLAGDAGDVPAGRHRVVEGIIMPLSDTDARVIVRTIHEVEQASETSPEEVPPPELGGVRNPVTADELEAILAQEAEVAARPALRVVQAEVAARPALRVVDNQD